MGDEQISTSGWHEAAGLDTLTSLPRGHPPPPTHTNTGGDSNVLRCSHGGLGVCGVTRHANKPEAYLQLPAPVVCAWLPVGSHAN